MKLFRLLTFSFIALFVMACTDNDKELTLSALTLESDANSSDLPVNKQVGFTLKGDDFIDYTSQMSLIVNGESVEDTTYVFTETGEFEVQAKVNDKISNTLQFDVTKGFMIDRKSLLKDQKANFMLYDIESGEEITEEGTYYANDELLDGSTFSSSSVGEYEVYAEYTDANGETQTSETDTIEVVQPTQQVLIEDYTGTWCGYCPRLQSVISEVTDATDYAVAIAIHKSSSDSNPDPYEYEYIDDLLDEYNEYGEFPKGMINRTMEWGDNDAETPLEYAGGESTIGIEAKTRTNDNELFVDVRIASSSDLSNAKIVVAALENNLVHEQTNYLNTDPDSEWYEAGNPIPEYTNNHVLRHAMTDIFGDNLPTIEALDDYSKSYSMNLNDYFEVNEEGEVAVFVLDADGTTLQAKKLGLNESLGIK